MLAAGLVLGVSTFANAQTTPVTGGDANNVSATVLSVIEIEQDEEIKFGQVVVGTLPSLNPIDGETTDAGSAATIGKFFVSGSSGADVKVTFEVSVTMASDPVSVPLQFNPSVSRVAGESTAAFGGTLYTSESIYAIDTSGTDTFFVGGTLSDAGDISANIPAAASGEFRGTFELTAQYD
jgi:hypothetical protein